MATDEIADCLSGIQVPPQVDGLRLHMELEPPPTAAAVAQRQAGHPRDRPDGPWHSLCGAIPVRGGQSRSRRDILRVQYRSG